jgi:hypothetical protein
VSLLREIQDLATSDSDMANLLRKCKILAVRLSNHEFSQWLDWELNVDPEDKLLPDYRSLNALTFATFMNAAWRAERQPILWEVLPEQARKALEHIPFRDGIAKAANPGKGGMIPRPDVAIRIEGKMFPDMHCISAWQEIPSHEFEQLKSAIKNRVLEFVLKIEAENLDAGEAAIGSKPIPQDKLQPLVNNFCGNVGNIAQHSNHFSQITNAGIDVKELARLVEELSKHLGELNLGERPTLRAEAQLAALRAELKGEPDLETVKQAGRTLRNITEGAIASLVAAGVQPTVWQWIHQALAAIS